MLTVSHLMSKSCREDVPSLNNNFSCCHAPAPPYKAIQQCIFELIMLHSLWQ